MKVSSKIGPVNSKEEASFHFRSLRPADPILGQPIPQRWEQFHMLKSSYKLHVIKSPRF